ncbi:B12-binding domain-containing radical SAM protein [Pedobacter kyonggii]|uniref:Radical SAM protein n=1 Tax=Pedobacter kyonggii TaxID=1926871 RepID=A0A4Q9HGG4_9SPHI|nr:radical SAM protein [Pedobacter kyonggii]TBO44297.1 radical SAM protein [Pedobacter kyonggii]
MKKIDLMLLPFWSPFIPPLGISILKSFLNTYGNFEIKTHDLNAAPEFLETHRTYMALLKKGLPEKYQGNINTIGNYLLMYHAVIHFRRSEHVPYLELLKELIYKHFNYDIEEEILWALDNELTIFYKGLSDYIDRYDNEIIPDVLGMSLFNGNIGPSLFVAKKIKEKYPEVKIIVGGGIFADQLFPGGPNFNALMQEMSSYLDKIIVGEGEVLFLKYLNGELDDAKKIYDSNKDLKDPVSFSELRTPDFDNLDMDRYPYISTFISRSCPFQCHFCSETIQWGKYRKRSIPEAVEEMIVLSEKYDRSLFLLGDSLLDPIITNLSTEILKTGRKLFWDGYLRVSKAAMVWENVMLWKSAGFYRARLGIESGSDKVLTLMNKGITKDEIRKTLKNLALAGIKTTTYWIAGYPGETDEDFEETLDLLRELNEYIYSAECHPFAFFLKGQVASDKWATELGVDPVFSDRLSEQTMMQTWRVKGSTDLYNNQKRAFKFNKVCEEYKIQNPYNFSEWYIADRRWKKLHNNSVPSLVELQREYKVVI